MRKLFASLILVVSCFATNAALAGPKVEFKTTMGNFVVELDDVKAPKTTANFLNYVKSGFYNGTIFHRVIDGFMIQGGSSATNRRWCDGIFRKQCRLCDAIFYRQGYHFMWLDSTVETSTRTTEYR